MTQPLPCIDVHCHLLPGIDDGPKTLDEALTMAQMAVDNGITHAVVTPHLHLGRWENTLSVAEQHYQRFKQALADQHIPLALGLACEARLDLDILALIARDQVPFLGELDGYHVLLLELPHSHIPVGTEQFICRLIQMGIRPLIAHPERNKDAMRNRDALRPLEDLGCLFQLTAGSLAGQFGESAEELALELLTSPATHIIASDCHGTKVRIPQLHHGEAIAAEILGKEAARRLVLDNPKQLVAPHFNDTGFSPRQRPSSRPVGRKPQPHPALEVKLPTSTTDITSDLAAKSQAEAVSPFNGAKELTPLSQLLLGTIQSELGLHVSTESQHSLAQKLEQNLSASGLLASEGLALQQATTPEQRQRQSLKETLQLLKRVDPEDQQQLDSLLALLSQQKPTPRETR